jgi:nucleoid-associated protein YgaU
MNAIVQRLPEVLSRFVACLARMLTSRLHPVRSKPPVSHGLWLLLVFAVLGAAEAAPDETAGQPFEAVQELRQQLAMQQVRITELQRLQAETERERQRLAAELDVLRLKASQGTELAEQIAALRLLTERLARLVPGDTADARASSGGSGDAKPAGEQQAVELADAQQRLAQLTDAYADAQQARQSAEAEASAALSRAVELEARLQQQQLALTEAQLRADKAEKLHAALEDARSRLLTENEKLKVELESARARQAEALEQAVRLDARLAAAEARSGQASRRADAVSVNGDEAPSAAGVSSISRGDTTAIDDDGSEPNPPQPAQPVVYRVREDDSLSKISVRFYGNSADWERIFAANRDVLDAPDKLAPGMQLIIP